MAHFILVHGAFHGAWCWDELIPELESLGHTASAIDLPGSGHDGVPSESVTLDDYIGRLEVAVNGGEAKPWLVGHSYGGLTVTQATEVMSDRIAGAIYISATIPMPGRTGAETSVATSQSTSGDATPESALPLDPKTYCMLLPEDRIEELFYGQCSADQVARARKLLDRRQGTGPSKVPIVQTSGRAGTVPRYYVECLDDGILPIEWQRQIQKNGNIARVATLPGDHSPFMSRPADLAKVMDDFVQG